MDIEQIINRIQAAMQYETRDEIAVRLHASGVSYDDILIAWVVAQMREEKK